MATKHTNTHTNAQVMYCIYACVHGYTHSFHFPFNLNFYHPRRDFFVVVVCFCLDRIYDEKHTIIIKPIKQNTRMIATICNIRTGKKKQKRPIIAPCGPIKT